MIIPIKSFHTCISRCSCERANENIYGHMKHTGSIGHDTKNHNYSIMWPSGY